MQFVRRSRPTATRPPPSPMWRSGGRNSTATLPRHGRLIAVPWAWRLRRLLRRLVDELFDRLAQLLLGVVADAGEFRPQHPLRVDDVDRREPADVPFLDDAALHARPPV